MQHRKEEYSNKDFSFCLEITLLSIADAPELFPAERRVSTIMIFLFVCFKYYFYFARDRPDEELVEMHHLLYISILRVDQSPRCV